MESLGGRHHKEHEEDFWSFSRPPLVVSFADPRIIELPASVMIALDVFVYEDLFSELLEKIHGAKAWPLFVTSLELQCPYDTDLKPEIKRAVMRRLAEAEALDIRQIVERYASERPDRFVKPQISHLAALAWKGDHLTLGEYQTVFDRGKHLNFSTSITKDIIDRALELSYDQVR